MSASNEMMVDIFGKAESVIAPSFNRVSVETVIALASLGEAIDGVWSKDWRITGLSNPGPGRYTIQLGAPIVHGDAGSSIVTHFVRGLNVLESSDHKANSPDFFTNSVLQALKKTLSVYRDGVSAVHFASKDDRASPTVRTTDQINRILEGGKTAWTTYRGRLSRVTIPENASRFGFGVEDQVTGKKIKCVVPHDKVREVADALDQRVAVTGQCVYSRNGEPVVLNVSSIRTLRPIAYKDIPPLKLTDGEDAADFVRRMRDAQ